MEYKRLGPTATLVPVIGQGADFRSGGLADDDCVQALRLGLELGMTLIDTAEVYGGGRSEEIVGRAIAGARDEVVVATKVSPEHCRFDDVLAAAEGSLRRLRTDRIDLYQVHWPNPAIPVDETMRALEQLVADGKVRYLGLSNFSGRDLRDARRALSRERIVAIQTEYNLFDRSIEDDLLPLCEAEDITVLAYSPLDQGGIAPGSGRRRRLAEIAARYEATPAQIALRWLTSRAPVVAIPRAARLAHVRENAATADLQLDSADVKAVDEIFAQQVMLVPPERIRVALANDRNVYRTLAEARENRHGYVPSPASLAERIRAGDPIKPVRLVAAAAADGRWDYDLVEGRIRYWAWVIAYDGQRSVPSLVREP